MYLSIICPTYPTWDKGGEWVGIWHTSVVLVPPLGETNIDKSWDELSSLIDNIDDKNCCWYGSCLGACDICLTPRAIFWCHVPYHSSTFAPGGVGYLIGALSTPTVGVIASAFYLCYIRAIPTLNIESADSMINIQKIYWSCMVGRAYIWKQGAGVRDYPVRTGHYRKRVEPKSGNNQ